MANTASSGQPANAGQLDEVGAELAIIKEGLAESSQAQLAQMVQDANVAVVKAAKDLQESQQSLLSFVEGAYRAKLSGGSGSSAA